MHNSCFIKLHKAHHTMKLPMIILFFSTAWHLILCGGLVNGEATFHFRNKCTFPVWPAAAPNAGHPVIADHGGFFLASGLTMRVEVPQTWNGRFWARTGCKFTSNSTLSLGHCDTGDCLGLLACNGTVGMPPVTLLEVALQEKEPSNYDVSLVDGYNIPISVSSIPADANCSIAGCSKDINSLCPKELQVLDSNNKTVACKSACLAFNTDSFCCRNKYGTPETCKPNSHTKMFKEACPNYFSHPFDNPPPLKKCSASEYIVTFCPSKETTSSPESKLVWTY